MKKLNELLDSLCDCQDTITYMVEAGNRRDVKVHERDRDRLYAEIESLFKQTVRAERDRVTSFVACLQNERWIEAGNLKMDPDAYVLGNHAIALVAESIRRMHEWEDQP